MNPDISPCPNCQQLSPTTCLYCSHCGQKKQPPTATLREFAGDLIDQLLSVDGRFVRTLGALFVPGRLTRAWIAGQRAAYLSPLRLTLFFALLFFMTLELKEFLRPSASSFSAGASDSASLQITAQELADCKANPECSVLQRRRLEWREEALRQPSGVAKLKDDLAGQVFSHALIFLLPIGAFMTAIAYRQRKLPFAVHFVYTLHVHCFAFLTLSTIFALNLLDLSRWPRRIIFPALALGLITYMLRAAQQVYGGRWWATVLRWFYIYLGYIAFSFLAFAVFWWFAQLLVGV